MTSAIPIFDTRELMLQLGDSALVLSHRLGEWSGLAPTLEEDLALSNIALDLLGQARFWLSAAGSRHVPPRDEDTLAYHRDSAGYRNLLLVEQPRGDFAQTIMRQFLFETWHVAVLRELAGCSDREVSEIAAIAAREATYHLDYSRDWLVCLGRGTSESRLRVVRALRRCWPYVPEMFSLHLTAVLPEFCAEDLCASWWRDVSVTLETAAVPLPDAPYVGQPHGVAGRHGEALVGLLAEMQFLTRSQPEAVW